MSFNFKMFDLITKFLYLSTFLLTICIAEHYKRSDLNECHNKIDFKADGYDWQPFKTFIPISSIKNNYMCDNDTILNTKIYYNGETNFYILLSEHPYDPKPGDNAVKICKYLMFFEKQC